MPLVNIRGGTDAFIEESRRNGVEPVGEALFVSKRASFSDLGKIKRLDDFGRGWRPDVPFGLRDCLPIEGTTLAHLWALCGIFDSVKQGRKNGWGKEIPGGLSKFTFSPTIEVHVWNVDGDGTLWPRVKQTEGLWRNIGEAIQSQRSL